jgi:tRNA-dihydrouridine synthase
MSNFWQQLEKPIFCLAPMEEVTDVAFREMFARYSGQELSVARPFMGWFQNPRNKTADKSMHHQMVLDKSARYKTHNSFVMFTEFINVDGLTHPEGRKNLEIDLKYTEIQRPIVAQLWGRSPLKFEEAAKIIVDLGFDGIDINMGCPQDKEIGQGTCAALIREPKLAQEIIQATKEGWLSRQAPTTPSANAATPPSQGGEAPRLSSDIPRSLSSFSKEEYPAKRGEVVGVPVSVKTRIGYSKSDEMEAWVKNLLEMDIAALTLHGRTKQQKSKVPANWQGIAEAVKVRDEMQSKTLILGNGDIKSRAEGLARVKETGVDGVMVGRGAFGNPWFFAQPNQNINAGTPRSFSEGGGTDDYQPNTKERLAAMLEHAKLFNELLGSRKSFYIMRKHFKAYASGFDGAHELRVKLLSAKDLGETEGIVEKYLSTASF